MALDVNFVRQMESELNGIPLCDDTLTFYYDETGNCGKFILTADGVNDRTALTNDFILGGIMFNGEVCPADTDALLKELRLSAKAKELKFDKVYKHGTEFMKFIGCRRISVFLQWLGQSGLHIHYATINNLYYALADLVDSLWESQPELAFSYEWVLEIKSAVFWFCKEHTDEFLQVLYNYHYPNISVDEVKPFAEEICELIQKYPADDDTVDINRAFCLECFSQMLKYAGRQGKLTFLRDNENDILVEEYFSLYLSRCCQYKNAMHHFDEAKEIRKRLTATNLTDNGNALVNYDFLDSKQHVLIQVCDVFVGLLAELFAFLDSISLVEVLFVKGEALPGQLQNLALINQLINAADQMHPMLIQNANDIFTTRSRMKKLEILVRDDVPGVKRDSSS